MEQQCEMITVWGTASKKAIERGATRAGHVIAYVSGRRDIDMLTLKDDEQMDCGLSDS